MIHAHALLGGSIAAGAVWQNNYYDTQFHEVGTIWRVSFTPTVAGPYMIQAFMKSKVGDGTYYSRLYDKARIVRIGTPNVQLSFHSENLVEFAGAYIRWFETSRTLFGIDVIGDDRLNTLQTYGLEHLAGDNLPGEINYGSPMVIIS